MIAAVREPTTDQQSAAPPPPGNPLRRGEWVRCPRCGAEGEAWLWALKRSPAYSAYTVEVFKCRARDCGHYFALTP